MTRASGKTSLICHSLINMFNDDDIIVCMYDDNPYIKALCRTSLNVIVVNKTAIHTLVNILKNEEGSKYLIADLETCKEYNHLFKTIVIC